MRGLTDVYEDVISPKFKRVAIHTHGRVHDDFSSGDVILPSMPGASNHFSFEFAFAEGAAAVQAGVIDCVEFTVDVRERDGGAVELEFPN